MMSNIDSKPRVIVLMGTYNGERFLREQIDSILNQKDVDVFLKVADDRSTDNTKLILEEYKNKYGNFDFRINDTNKNFTYNFIDLLFSIYDDTFDYCAFSDQDDVWCDDKLISAINKIRNKKGDAACLYCSNLIIVDENLKKIALQEDESVLKMTKHNFLVSNITPGCTMVMNHAFFKRATEYYPNNIYLHDYWVFLIGVFVEDYVYDMEPHILYRQHSNNQIGSGKKVKKESFKKRLYRYSHVNMNPKYSVTFLLKELLNGYEKYISKEDIKKIKDVAYYKENFIKWVKLFFSHKIRGRERWLRYKVITFFRNW